MIHATSLNKGAVLVYQGEICFVTYAQFVNPGKGSAFVRTKLKNLSDGRVVEKTFKSSDKVEQIELEKKEMQFLYKDEEENYHFMDTEDFEQISVSKDMLDPWQTFLKEEMICQVNFHDGKAISITPPTFADLIVTEAPEGLKGNTAGTARKRVTLETGAEVLVPLHIHNKDLIRIDLRDFSFAERLQKKIKD